MTEDENDRKRVAECLAGNADAFAGIVDRYERPVYNVVYRMVGNSSDAEEVTQIVFTKAYENLAKFNPSFRFFTWIYRIAVNEAINYQKSKKHHEQLSDEEHGTGDETPESLYVTHELRDSLERAIGFLKEEYRLVVVLRHLQDLSYDEIGRILGITTKQVKSRLFTARTQLREVLRERLHK